MNLFAPLAMKIAGGIVALLLIVIFILYLSLQGEKRHSRKVEGKLATANAMIETQNAAVNAWKAEAERRSQAAQEALQRAKAQSKVSEATARRIEAPRPLSGRCQTPTEVREAGL